MELVILAGIVPASDGLTRARSLGIMASAEGIKAVLENPEIKIVFDATRAKAHIRHAKALRETGRIAIGLTPAPQGGNAFLSCRHRARRGKTFAAGARIGQGR